MTICHGLSFDVEEAFHALNMWEATPPDSWPKQPSRVEAATDRILGVLDAWSVRATFFVLGLVAERTPSVVRRIAEAGHELASHGYSHEMAGDLGPKRFAEDVQRARDLLQDISGTEVAGFRASTFSIGRGTRWALRLVARCGHSWDSSIFPVRHDRYGDPDFPSAPVHLDLPGGETLLEYPLLTRRWLGLRLPAAGGGYLRLLPFRLVDGALRAARRRGTPGVIYLHPWEMDPDQPRHDLGTLRNLRHYHGMERVEARLERLLEHHRFGPVGEIVVSEDRRLSVQL